MYSILVFLLLLSAGVVAQTQEDPKAVEQALEASNNYTYEANQDISEDKFVEAEVDYRKAISKSDKNVIAPYNLGNAYYNGESYNEAYTRFKEAGERAEEKPSKHKAFHNMGNVFMKNKDYGRAVEAYKEALRNDPTDEETRYNLALGEGDAEKNSKTSKRTTTIMKMSKKIRIRKRIRIRGLRNRITSKIKEKKEKDKDEQKNEDKRGDGEEKKDKENEPNKNEEQKQQKPQT